MPAPLVPRSISEVITAAVAGADVQVAVLADLQVSGVVAAISGHDAVEQDCLAGRIDGAVVLQDERDTRFRGAPAGSGVPKG